jgi:tetratricopeptide (TPR) repeat protein
LAWPEPLVFDYKWPVAATWTAVGLPGVVVAGALLAAAWGFMRRQAWAYPIAWYLIVLSPSSSLAPLYDDYIAEYRVYLPSVGPIVLVVCGAWLLLRKIVGSVPRRAFVGTLVGAVVVCTLGGLTWARNIDYRTELSLWRDTAAKASNNERALWGFGDALQKQGQYDEAIKEYREALRLHPDNVLVLSNLGVALAKQGHLDEAIEQFREVLRTAPNNADAHYNVGIALAQQGHPEQALQEYNEVLRLNPNDVRAYNNLAVALANLGDREGSLKALRQALAIDPNNADARNNIRALEAGNKSGD